MAKNLFVVGMDKFNLSQLQSLKRAENYRFHSLISYEKIKCGNRLPVPEFIQQAHRTLTSFKGTVDAVIGFWDFPVSTMLPILRSQIGLGGPSLSAVLKCEHKYWSRLKQAEVIPEMVPPFQKINPFNDDAESTCCLAYPFWLKPIKSVASHLGFLIRDSIEFKESLRIIREHIGRYATPFNFILDMAHLPEEIREVDGFHCIAEGLISQGPQCTLEGYVHKGSVHVYGIVDSLREGPHHSTFWSYQYPSLLPDGLQERMIKATEKILKHLDYDDSPFNVEFYWNPQKDEIRLLEINTRISKSHCPLFKMVDGEYHHDVMIDVALGNKPDFPRRQGKFAAAAKFMLRSHKNGRIIAVPDKSDIDRVKERFPGSEVFLNINNGMQLSELKDQDSYSYMLADLFMGAKSHQELLKNYRTALSMLPFSIDHNEEAV